MPEAHRLLGFILMQLGAPRRARDEYAKSKAEVELLLMQARTALDPSIDVQVALNDLALNDLQARFPNDELINEAVHLNSNTE